MTFEDPRTYLRNGTLYDYTIRLHYQFAPIANDMYNRFINRLKYPRCIFEVLMIGPTGYDGKTLRNGLFIPPAKIQIYLLNIALSAYDNCIALRRTDFDTLMTAELAYTIIHEISHSIQNTYITDDKINAMEYANDKHIFQEIIPQIELILKRVYKINIYNDRVDGFTNKAYSYPFIQSSPTERILNLILYNTFCAEPEVITSKEINVINQYRELINNVNNVIITIKVFENKVSLPIKQNGVYLEENAIKLFEIGSSIPNIYGFNSSMNQSDSTSTIELIYEVFNSAGYCPINNTAGEQFKIERE